MSDLKPGRALDALVAEKVMGFNVVREQGEWIEKRRGKDATNIYTLGFYSTSISAAWEVVEKLDFDMEIEQFLDSAKQRTYRVNFMERGRVQNVLGYAFSDMIAEAICLAALKVVGEHNA